VVNLHASRLRALLIAHTPGERRCELALFGAYRDELGDDDVLTRLETLVTARREEWLLRLSPRQLTIGFAALRDTPYPGRAEALRAIAHALDTRVPASEYELPESTLAGLLERIAALRGQKIPLSGPATHKGRIGDGLELLLLGARVVGKRSDHPAAEVKTVPVRGDRVLERVKLGVVSGTSNPTDKCDRILFVFVEQRGDDYFIAGHETAEFDHDRWRAMWESGALVETSAGTVKSRARGLYLVPKWFRAARLWPSR
jgi:hypothetical protein